MALDWLDLDMNGILVLIPALANNKSLRWGENDISTNGIQALSAELQSDFVNCITTEFEFQIGEAMYLNELQIWIGDVEAKM